jgi:formylglycine-generating enzyme required for sulfatase activity
MGHSDVATVKTDPSHPVVNINITNAYHWCNAFSLLIGAEPCYYIEKSNGELEVMRPGQSGYEIIHYDASANGVRLPDGNEWEYAARGGLIRKPYPWGDGSPSGRSNYTYNQLKHTTPVGTFEANGYGLYDVAGNVGERVWDTGKGPSVDIPSSVSTSAKHIGKGGTWSLGHGPKVTLGFGFDPWHRGSGNGLRIARNLEGKVVDLNSTVSLEMIWVEPGTFTMGSPESEVGRGNDETQHEVTLTKGFYLGKYEVTQSQYEAVMTGNTDGLNATPSQYSGNPDRPVEKVSWNDIQVFLTRLNAQEAGNIPTGWGYVLPTEAQWEYACRAGTTTAYSWGDTIASDDANYNWDGDWNTGTDFQQTRDVGQYSANPWGFFDMHGNVWEWTADAYGTYASGAQTDPFNEGATGSNRVARGGSWGYAGSYSRSAKRFTNDYPSNRRNVIGFRVGLMEE